MPKRPITPVDPASLPFPIPPGASAYHSGKYIQLGNMHGHPLVKPNGPGTLGYHRYVCFQSLNQPSHSKCVHCGYMLPWRSDIGGSQAPVVHVDHLDANPANNHPSNLAPACWWCNVNRPWAELYPTLWAMWRRWFHDVPPAFRPPLSLIALDFGISAEPAVYQNKALVAPSAPNHPPGTSTPTPSLTLHTTPLKSVQRPQIVLGSRFRTRSQT